MAVYRGQVDKTNVVDKARDIIVARAACR